MNFLIRNQTTSSQPSIYPSESRLKKVIKNVLPVFFVAGCVSQHKELNLLVRQAYRAFLGKQGWATPAFMISGSLTMKYILFLNQKSDDPSISNASRVFIWLKKAPKDLITGVKKLPESLLLGLTIITIAKLTFKLMQIEEVNYNLNGTIEKTSVFELAVQTPFLEELFFREILEGSLISSLKLMNVLGSRMGRGAIITDATIHTSSRVLSAVTFGLAHANQKLIQAIKSGVTSYFYETWLYEKHGFFASFGKHCANNFLVSCLKTKIKII